jgi:hypothetical protein
MPETITSYCMPALQVSFYRLDQAADVFNWK